MPFEIRPSTRILLAALLSLPIAVVLPALPAALSLPAVLMPGAEVFAQVRTVGAITGAVTDPEDNPVPGATVALRDERTNISRESVSNDQGSFLFLDLQSGSYEVTVTLTGFQSTVFKNVAVESARTTDLAVRLNVGQVTEAVEVVGAAPTLAVTTNTLSTTVTHADVQNLPLSGRSVLNFAGGLWRARRVRSRHRRRAPFPGRSDRLQRVPEHLAGRLHVRQLHVEPDHADRIPLRTPAQPGHLQHRRRRRSVRHQRPPHAARVSVPARAARAESVADRSQQRAASAL